MSSFLRGSLSAVLSLDLSAHHKLLILRTVRAGGQGDQLVTVLDFRPCINTGPPRKPVPDILQNRPAGLYRCIHSRGKAVSICCVQLGIEGSKHFIVTFFFQCIKPNQGMLLPEIFLGVVEQLPKHDAKIAIPAEYAA